MSEVAIRREHIEKILETAFASILLVCFYIVLFGSRVYAEQTVTIAKPSCSGVYVDRDGAKHT